MAPDLNDLHRYAMRYYRYAELSAQEHLAGRHERGTRWHDLSRRAYDAACVVSRDVKEMQRA